jgi:hypothetical protein
MVNETRDYSLYKLRRFCRFVDSRRSLVVQFSPGLQSMPSLFHSPVKLNTLARMAACDAAFLLFILCRAHATMTAVCPNFLRNALPSMHPYGFRVLKGKTRLCIRGCTRWTSVVPSHNVFDIVPSSSSLSWTFSLSLESDKRRFRPGGYFRSS